MISEKVGRVVIKEDGVTYSGFIIQGPGSIDRANLSILKWARKHLDNAIEEIITRIIPSDGFPN